MWQNRIRAHRVDYVSDLSEWSVDNPVVESTSPSGYTGGYRRLIVPSHNTESYQWIAQTQQMFARGEWRVREVDYENAPLGREVHAASPYRWWLGLLAWLNHLSTGRPLGQAVERAALYADPTLQILLLLSATVFAARYFGSLAASLLACGIVGLFPFGGGFIPGAPNQHGLVQAVALWSLLPLLVGMKKGCHNRADTMPERRRLNSPANRWFFLGGALGGLGLWLSVGSQLPLLLGIALGAVGSAWIIRRNASGANRTESTRIFPWRAWALGGAIVSVTGYLLEYFPHHLKLQLGVNNPLFALAWLGLGELLAQTTEWIQGQKPRWTRRDVAFTVLAALAVGLVPALMSYQHRTLGGQEGPAALRLSLIGGVIAPTFLKWISRDGINAVVWATCLPLTLGLIAAALTFRPGSGRRFAPVALALGPVVAALILAGHQLWWWNLVDASVLALLVAATAALSEPATRSPFWWGWCAIAAVLLIPGFIQLWPKPTSEDPSTLTDLEGESYIERDLAHWLANQVGSSGGRVLASPNLTTALSFYGGLSGLATFNWENDQGTTVAVRMVSALSRDEALALLSSRGVTHIILPSWDTFLDDYASMGMRTSIGSERFDQSFLGQLHRWDLPPWLRAIPYPLPATAGADRSVVIFEVVEEQDPSAALGRLTEYFIEMQQLDRAAATAQELQRFPGDVGALATLVQVETARGDPTAATATFTKLLPFVSRSVHRSMPLDRRVSLAVVLAQQKRTELAKEQMVRCLADLDEARLRSLTTVSLYRFELLCKLYGLHIPDPRLEELARSLLRPELRARL